MSEKRYWVIEIDDARKFGTEDGLTFSEVMELLASFGPEEEEGFVVIEGRVFLEADDE